ncbi:hypothetical protein NKDENANG_01652 [Candidatus Entotheonellaceae bacterium PAL068K]
MVNVEAIPYDVIQAGIDWQWESYEEYRDAVGQRGLGLNVAGLVAFTPLRHYVMGGRGTIEVIVNSAGMYLINDNDGELLRQLTDKSMRPVTWLALFARPGEPDFHHEQTLSNLGDLLQRAMPQITPRPIYGQGDLRNPTMFGSFLSWQDVFNCSVTE